MLCGALRGEQEAWIETSQMSKRNKDKQVIPVLKAVVVGGAFRWAACSAPIKQEMM